MRTRRVTLALVWLLAFVPGASAAELTVLGSHGHWWRTDDRFVPATPDVPVSQVRRAPARPAAAGRRVTVGTTLDGLVRHHQLARRTARSYLGQLRSAQATERRLSGTRAAELGAVIANLSWITQSGQLTAARLPALFLTLRANQRWWSSGPLLGGGDRVALAGSQIVWEYYAGQGIELQALGSFGKANGLFAAGRRSYPQMLRLLGELIPLASQRAGGLAWEYYFAFESGTPPWASAMAQGTAIESLTRAYRVTHDRRYLVLAHRALPLFGHPPPTGAELSTRHGRRYLQYTFAPGESILNAFLQSLIGLYDYAHASHDATAGRLFAAGDAEARAEVPSFDTGGWSLYEPGQEDSLDYHQLVTGFLHSLCDRTHARVYCSTAANFDADLHRPAALALLTQRVSAGGGTIRFRVSKPAHVGIVVTRGARTAFLTSGDFSYGVGGFTLPSLPGPGTYGVRLAATDLAGNFGRITGTLTVSR